LVTFAQLPFGGSVTLFSQLPLVLIAYRYGAKWGVANAMIAGVFQQLLGLNNLQYATNALALAGIILLDYVVAFGAMGLAGVFRKSIQKQAVSLAVGTLFASVLRYACHVITGIWIWGVWAPDGQSILAYSLGYNAAFMIPETIVTIAGAVFVSIFLDFSKENLIRKSTKSL
jgi:thiamine transporter